MSWACAPGRTQPQSGGYLDPMDADRFVAQFDGGVRRGRFSYAVTFFLTAGTLPLSD